MHRQRCIRHRGMLLTRGTIKAFQALEEQAFRFGWQLSFSTPKVKAVWDPKSMAETGLTLLLKLRHLKEDRDLTARLAALWGLAVPLGFTPERRFPEPGHDDDVFYFLGPWQPLLDRLMAEGRGHLSWPSVCAAAQCDVGVWKGEKENERFAQAQLHRLGLNCGPIDGNIGPRTTQAIRTLGLTDAALEKVIEYLQKADSPKVDPDERTTGHITIPGRDLVITAFGGVSFVREKQGATLSINGKGRVILDIGEAS